jgi:cysteine desulfurase family protein (TIGR01976 family)
VARAVSRNWRPGDEIVVTELDHRAGVDPWITAAADKGVTVRWLKVDPETLTLDYSRLDEIIHEKTVLVSVGLASNVVGTVNDVRLAAKKAKRHGALMVVDAVHAVPHIAIDRDQLGADILLCSVYKFFGPHIGVAAIKKETFEKMEPYKISPAPGCIPDKLETGTQNHEGIAGIRPAVDFIASLGAGETRRARIVSAMERIEAYENSLAEKIREELSRIHGVRLYQAPRGIRKTPTIAFTLDGRHPREVCRFAVDQYSVFIADGDFYAATLAEKLNLKESGGWIRAGLAPYNTLEEAERLIAAVKRCAR